MGFTASGGPRGLGVFNTTPKTASDLNKLVELIGRVGNYRGPLTETERDAISGDALYDGLMVYNTTAGALEIRADGGWEAIWAPATSPGSVVPVAGANFTLSNNNLFIRNGLLIGTIDWARTSGSVVHGDTFMTLPVGARPSHQSVAPTSASPSNSYLILCSADTNGEIVANQPPSGRTNGTFRFNMPIPIV